MIDFLNNTIKHINKQKIFFDIRSFVFFALINVNFIYSQTINLTSPNGGEILSFGFSINIEWTSIGISSVSIEYSINGGANWKTVATNVPSPGTYLWAVPNEPTTLGLVKVKNGSTMDSNASFFFIKSPQFSVDSTIKILPIGNSITYDQMRAEFRYAQDKISYRYFLWDNLRTNNYNIDFIGHKLGGYSQFPDPENNGIPGIKDNQMLTLLSSGYDPITENPVTSGNYLITYHPDIVLLHIGTNGVDVDQSATDVESILNWIDDFEIAQSKDIWVILALIIDDADNALSDTGGNDPSITTFNNNIKNMAQVRINNGDKILIVDMQHDAGLYYHIDTSYPYTDGDMYDGLHPNDSGKAKMANLWFEALKIILPNSITSSPNITSMPITTAYVGLPYRYNVNASGVGAPDYLFVTTTYIPPSGMNINQTTGIIDWTPRVSDVGNHTIEVKAHNSPGGDSPIQQFTINVLSTPTLTNNLVSYWRLDETGTPSSFEDLPGINDAYPIDAPISVSGIVGNALSFNGTTNKVDVLDDSSLYFLPGESFTIETWVKTTQGGSTEKVFLGKFDGYVNYSLGVNTSNQTKFEIKDSVGNTITVFGPAVNDGIWHHLAGCVNRANSRLSIYVDGVRNSTNWTFDPSGFFSHDPLTLGYYKYNNFYSGLLDEVAIYNRRVPGFELARHYISGLARKEYSDKYVLVKVKAFLQGPFNGTNMNTTLRDNNYIPLDIHPYTLSPWNYDGLERVPTYPDGVVDWVLVELRDPVDPSIVISRRAAFIKDDGNIIEIDPYNTLGSTDIIFPGVKQGNYYIAIKHRNHLGIMSSAAHPCSTSSSTLYDFTTGQDKAFTTGPAPMADLGGGKFGMFVGDANSDGTINAMDYNNYWLIQNGTPYDYSMKLGDFNLDATINEVDFNNYWLLNNGKATQVQ